MPTQSYAIAFSKSLLKVILKAKGKVSKVWDFYEQDGFNCDIEAIDNINNNTRLWTRSKVDSTVCTIVIFVN